MQKNNSLCPEFCGFRAPEEISVIFWIKIELSRKVQDLSHNSRKPTPGPNI